MNKSSIRRLARAFDAVSWKEEEHPRDEDGKFTSGGSNSSGRSEETERRDEPEREKKPTKKRQYVVTSPIRKHPKKPKAIGTVSETLPGGSHITRLDPKYVKPGTTATLYSDGNGKITPKREKLHDEIVNEIFKGKKKLGPDDERVFTMLGGGSGAGKSTVLKSGMVSMIPDEKSCTTIDADEIKKMLPEYKKMQESDPDNAANFVHTESSALSERAMEAGLCSDYNCTLDGTGDGGLDDVLSKIEYAHSRGYKANAVYATCPTEEAIKRAQERARETKRNVHPDYIERVHAAVSWIVPQVAAEFDNFELYDTSGPKGTPPKLIASCKRGEEMQIHNKDLYDAFVKKGIDYPEKYPRHN